MKSGSFYSKIDVLTNKNGWLFEGIRGTSSSKSISSLNDDGEGRLTVRLIILSREDPVILEKRWIMQKMA